MGEMHVVSGVVLDEAVELTLADLARACAVHAEVIVALVDEGLIEPRGGGPAEWRFPGPALTRAATALRQQRDLQLNLAGVALALELLDEVRALRGQLARLQAPADQT